MTVTSNNPSAAPSMSFVYDQYANRWGQNVTSGGPQPQLSYNTATNQVNTAGYSYDVAPANRKGSHAARTCARGGIGERALRLCIGTEHPISSGIGGSPMQFQREETGAHPFASGSTGCAGAMRGCDSEDQSNRASGAGRDYSISRFLFSEQIQGVRFHSLRSQKRADAGPSHFSISMRNRAGEPLRKLDSRTGPCRVLFSNVAKDLGGMDWFRKKLEVMAAFTCIQKKINCVRLAGEQQHLAVGTTLLN
jgi:hypothetical protein